MGRLIMISLIFISLFITTIIVSPWERSHSIPDMMVNEELYSETRRIGNYALNFAIRELADSKININEGIIVNKYDDFSVLHGAIDSIKYEAPTIDEITVTAYVYCNISGEELYKESKMLLYYMPMLVSPTGVENAITTDGTVKITGSSDVDGNVSEQDTTFVFEDIFGYTKEQIKNNATHYYYDPYNNILPVDNVTWVEVPEGEEFVVSYSTWNGSGILIVNGDCKFTGGYFEGIMWVCGDMRVDGNPELQGALFIEGGSDFQTKIIGNPIINFNSDACDQTYALTLGASDYHIMAWYE